MYQLLLVSLFSKLRMLEFYYNCIDRFVDRTDFQYVEIARIWRSLKSILKPGMEKEFWEEYRMLFPRRACVSHNSEFIDCMLSGGTWVQGECCKQITKHDSRTPGLFKEEYKGTGAVALNSKTYVCRDSIKSTSKASSKGINKRLNVQTADVYKGVLQTRHPFTVINRGFVVR